jgi:hypothetical protein
MHSAGILNERAGSVVAPVRTRTKFEIRQEQLDWLRKVLAHTKENPSQLATNSGLADNALTRFLKEDYEGTLSSLTIRLISDYAKVPGPGAPNAPGQRGFEEEATTYDHKAKSADPIMAHVIATMIEKRQHATAKRLQTRALEDVGYLPGDILIIDPDETPLSGDVVCAQIYDLERGGAGTVYRVFKTAGRIELLMPGADEPESAEARQIDNNVVRIWGVVTESFRPRARRAA